MCKKRFIDVVFMATLEMIASDSHNVEDQPKDMSDLPGVTRHFVKNYTYCKSMHGKPALGLHS
jgi:tyrosine-protein phosphatase YwqE